MKKRLFFLACFLFLLILSSAYSASDSLVDDADLLSAGEASALSVKISQIYSKYQFEPVIVTTYGTQNKSITDFAADYYDENGYGYGKDHDGLIFVIDMKEREYVTVTTGYGIYAFSDYGIEQMENKMVSLLSSGQYYRAFESYLSSCEAYLQQAQDGVPYDIYDTGGYTITVVTPLVQTREALPIILLIALLGSGISMGVSVSKMKTARRKETAANYVKDSAILGRNDIFLRASESRVRISSDPPGGSSGGHFGGSSGGRGGSSTFSGSSGTSHGGGHSGRF